MAYSRKLEGLPADTRQALTELLEQVNILQEESERQLDGLERRVKELEESAENE